MKLIRSITFLLAFVMLTSCGAFNEAVTDTDAMVSVATAGSNVDEETLIVTPLAQQKLIVNLTPEQYTYEDLTYDLSVLDDLCGSSIRIDEICTTVDGRKVYDIIVGDINSESQILIFGAIHAREYITAQVVMRQLCDCIDAINGYSENYNDIPINELLENVTIHFIPMSNPDGVTLSQLGLDSINKENIRNNIIQMGCMNYEQWKSNANGIDLNRNFDAGWNEYVGSPTPSSERYKGEYPGSEAESAALIKLTQDYKIKRSISYHTCGSLIYWYYKQSGDVLEESRAFAERISTETGYFLDSDYTGVDAAGYKDWAVYKLGIPSITIEVGNENGTGIINPVPISYFKSIWQRNKNVVYATVYNLKYDG